MNLAKYLFQTEALKVSPFDKPFFYTSGKLGPFYINTHYLYGSKKKAVELLEYIDTLLIDDRENIPEKISKLTAEQYDSCNIFKKTIDELIIKIKGTLDVEKYEYVSGGERRDWFFSFIVAKLLKKKHITIFKDKSIIDNSNSEYYDRKVIHICDLVTEASSFSNYWIPALNSIGISDISVFSVVDRDQGGEDYFLSKNLTFESLIRIDLEFFEKALEQNMIDLEQKKMIENYIADPDDSMKKFLLNNIDFLTLSLGEKGKELDKAKILIEKNIYGLPTEYLRGINV